MKHSQRTMAAVSLLVALVGLVTLSGCQHRITGHSVRKDMSPELESLAMTPEQHKNRDAASTDTTMRQIHDDWDSFWLMRKPSHMSRITVP